MEKARPPLWVWLVLTAIAVLTPAAMMFVVLNDRAVSAQVMIWAVALLLVSIVYLAVAEVAVRGRAEGRPA